MTNVSGNFPNNPNFGKGVNSSNNVNPDGGSSPQAAAQSAQGQNASPQAANTSLQDPNIILGLMGQQAQVLSGASQIHVQASVAGHLKGFNEAYDHAVGIAQTEFGLSYKSSQTVALTALNKLMG